MTENLDDLLSGHGFFNIPVQRTQRRLLGFIEPAASHGDKAGCLHHDRNHQHSDQSQPDIGIYHQAEGAYHIDHTGNYLYYGIVEHFPHRIHIVGKTAHNIAMIIRIIKAHRQLLYFGKQLISYFKYGLLGYSDHNPGLQILGGNTEQVNASHEHQGMKQLLRAALR